MIWKTKKEEIIDKITKIINKIQQEYNIKNIIISVKTKDNKEEIKKELENIFGKNKNTFEANIVLIIKKGHYKIIYKILPIYIKGYYNKYSEIPQSPWFCPNCYGKGCKVCNFTGFKYPTSIQQEITKATNKLFKSTNTILHAAGREDKDALCIGYRPFVIEIENPKTRYIDLKELEKAINNSKKIEVKLEKYVDKTEVKKIKSNKFAKRYTALILPYDVDISKVPINKIITLKQQTPIRVLHRRTDKERIKKIIIKSLKIDFFEDTRLNIKKAKYLILDIITEAGTYVKEFVSSDQGRTKPSLSEFCGKDLKVKHLIVTGFYNKKIEELRF